MAIHPQRSTEDLGNDQATRAADAESDGTGVWQAANEEPSSGTVDLPAPRHAEADDPTGTVDMPATDPPVDPTATIDVPAPQDSAEPEGGTGVWQAEEPAGGATADLPAPADNRDETGVFQSGLVGECTVDERPGKGTRDGTGGADDADRSLNSRSGPTAGGARSLSRQVLGTQRQRQGDVTGAATPDQAPAVLDLSPGRFNLNKFFAKGGMGEIWLAQDQDLGRSVALKRMRRGADAEQKDLFLREAQITGQLQHPGIVPVHELGEDENGEPFYVMKFIQGPTLTKAIKECHEPPAPGKPAREVLELRLLRAFVNLCQTVAFAHAQRIIHRDLKPDNVMVGAYGETLLLDWGLAKTIGEADTPGTPGHVRYSYSGGESLATLDGAIKGTPTYMSPEVAEGWVADIDEASDIYLLGGTLYHILTNQPPRYAKKVTELIRLAREVPPPPPRQLVPRVPKALDAICMKAMAHRKQDRYPTAQAIVDDMERFLAGEPVTAYQENFWERAARFLKKHRVLIGRVVTAVFVLGLVTGLVLFGYSEIRKAEERAERDRIANEAKVKKAEEETAEQKRKADLLGLQKRAAASAVAFRLAADDTHRLFALQDPGTENLLSAGSAPTERQAEAAIGHLREWGPALEQWPLSTPPRAALSQQLYDVLLLLAETRSGRGARKDAAADTLTLLDRAARLRQPTTALLRLRADCQDLLGRKDEAAQTRGLVNAKETPVTALDWFLTAERLRIAHVRAAQGRDVQNFTKEQNAQLEEAIAAYRQAIALDFNDFWSHFQLGTCYLLERKDEMALGALSACVALRPDSAWGYTLRGHIEAQIPKDEYRAAARRDLERAIQLDPKRREALLQRGVLGWLEKRYDDALADFKTVLEPPDDQRLLEAAFYRGQLHLERGELDEAFADFSRVLKERPHGHPAALRRARIELGRGNVKQGLADLDAFLTGGALAPDSAALYAERGRRLRQMVLELPPTRRKGQLELALKQLQTAIDRGTRDPAVHDELGMVFEFLGRVPEAIAAYTVAVQLQPKDARILVKRAWAHEKLSEYAKAEADFAAALKRDPNHAEAHAGLAYILACRNQASAGAAAHAIAAALEGPGDYLVLHNVACVFGKLADVEPKRAREHQDVALTLLRRELELWQRDRTGPNPLGLIRGEPAFGPGLRQRPEFRKLLEGTP